MDKRRHKRLAVGFDLHCRLAGDFAVETHCGRAVNVSPAGLYFHTAGDGFTPGTMVNVELTIPPKSGGLERFGRVSATGKVIRAERISAGKTSSDANKTAVNKTGSREDCYGVAIEFCRAPKLATML